MTIDGGRARHQIKFAGGSLGRQPRAATSHLVVPQRLLAAHCRHSNGPDSRRSWIQAGGGPTADGHTWCARLWPVYDRLQTTYKGARLPSKRTRHTCPRMRHVHVLTATCVSRSCTGHWRRPPAGAPASTTFGGGTRRSSSTRAAAPRSLVRPPAACGSSRRHTAAAAAANKHLHPCIKRRHRKAPRATRAANKGAP